MAVNTNFGFVPLVGTNNIVTVNDSGTMRQGVVQNSAFLPVVTGGSGTTPSSIVEPPEGRVGGLRTVFNIVTLSTQTNVAADLEFNVLVNVPSGQMGYLLGNSSYAASIDTANFPQVDGSLVTPIVLVQPTHSVYWGTTNREGSGYPAEAPGVCWGENCGFGGGVDAYFSPAFMVQAGSGYGNVGQNGVVVASIRIDLDAGVTDIPANAALQVTIDFSHTFLG